MIALPHALRYHQDFISNIIANAKSMPVHSKIVNRCICGQAIAANIQSGDKCNHCGRQYSGQDDIASMTMTMPVGGTESPREPEDELVGKFLDHFTIISRLGGGGMGTVYRATR